MRVKLLACRIIIKRAVFLKFRVMRQHFLGASGNKKVKNMKQIKTLLEIAKDLEYLASDMKKSNDEFFKNIFGFAGDIRDKSQAFSSLPLEEDEEAIDNKDKEVPTLIEMEAERELELDHDRQMKEEEGLGYEDEPSGHIEDPETHKEELRRGKEENL